MIMLLLVWEPIPISTLLKQRHSSILRAMLGMKELDLSRIQVGSISEKDKAIILPIIKMSILISLDKGSLIF